MPGIKVGIEIIPPPAAPTSMFKSLFPALSVLVLLSGCASVSVTKLRQASTPQAPTKPETIYVALFEAPEDVLKVDRESGELSEFKVGLQNLLQSETIKRLEAHVAPAKALKSSDKLPDKGWLVRGRFVRVEQGSRALRLAVGLGAGGTKLETEVQVLDLAASRTTPFLSFVTTGGSNAEPGAVTGLIAMGPIDLAIGVAAGAASVASHGLTEDVERTGHEITAELSEIGATQGWVPPDKAIKAKKLNADTPNAYLPPQSRR
jgi:hypothetical protein